MVHFDMWMAYMAVDDMPIDRKIVDYMDLDCIGFARSRFELAAMVAHATMDFVLAVALHRHRQRMQLYSLVV